MELHKIKIKVKWKNSWVWTHFCYVPDEVALKFFELNKEGQEANYWIAKWAKEDFGPDVLETEEDLNRLKLQIKELYKSKYPELYIDSATDKQGWLRVWCKTHMEKELENHV
jgi:hypothetical protein